MKRDENVCTWAPLIPLYRVMTICRCAEVGWMPAAPGLCDLVTWHSPVRSGPGKEAARPADRYSTCRFTSLPSGSGSARGTAITLPASQIFVLWAINLYGCKDYSPTSDNNCLGSPLHNYFLAVFWTRCLQPFWKLKQNCYLTAITLVATSYWNVVTNNWVSCDPSRG